MSKIYIGDIGTIIEIDMGTDISTAITHNILVRKGTADIITWSATIYNNNYLRFTTIDGSLDVAGIYFCQPILSFPDGWSGRGETVSFIVYDLFK